MVNSFGRKSILVVFVLLLACSFFLNLGGDSVVAADSGKYKVVREVARNYIEAGKGHLDRGYFTAAEQSFMRALDYQEYLTDEERSSLSDLLDKAHAGALGKRRVVEAIEAAEQLIADGDMVAAKSQLDAIKGSEYLSKEDELRIAESLSKIEGSLSGRRNAIAVVYNRSVELFEAGDYAAARKGFVEVSNNRLLVAPEGKTAEDYIARIDAILGSSKVTSTVATEVVEVPLEEGVTEARMLVCEAEPVVPTDVEEVAITVSEGKAVEEVTETSPYIDIVNRRRGIVRGHTEAVIADAKQKAAGFVSEGEFDKARDAVGLAQRLVDKNHLSLGEDLYKKYSQELFEISETISRAEAASRKASEEQKRLEALEAQKRFRLQMEEDRRDRIEDLMSKALTYQRQQRYEEALGQLQSLLAIDPMNDQALVMKQTLEDMIGFRKQLEIQRESDQERVNILVETDESAIPYAEELTHPKNWREIDAKRQPEESMFQDPVNNALYEQLDEIVDLSELNPAMSFNEAIEVLRNSVDPRLKMVVLWRDLIDNAEVDQTTPINMDGIAAVPLGTALKLLMESVSSFVQLGYVVEDGVIKIATTESLKVELETRVYDVTILLGQPADFHAAGGTTSGGGGSSSRGGGSRGGGSSSGSGDSEDFSEYFDEEDDEMSREELAQKRDERREALIRLIQDTIEPDSWFDTGEGEGTINAYQGKKLIVMQTRDVHKKIETLLQNLRKSLGEQVAIEARFLVVGENFLEDIGLDVDFPVINTNSKFGEIEFLQNSATLTAPQSTGILGSFGASGGSGGIQGSGVAPSGEISGGYGTVLDDLQVTFLLKATQAHRDSESLTAPKVTVLSGESATFRNQRTIRYGLLPDIGSTDTTFGGGGSTSTSSEQNYGSVITGTVLSITPTITPDRKHVLLNITTELRDFLGFETTHIQVPDFSGNSEQVFEYDITLPQTEISRIKTRVSVPDSGTLLLGGQKITGEAEIDAGVPVLSKIPVIGRAFNNRSKIKDSKILLVLVKPTIILQDEADAEALAKLQDEF